MKRHYDIEFMHMHHKKKRGAWVALILACVTIVLAIGISWSFIHQATQAQDGVMAEQIHQLGHIFKRIHECCRIIDFRQEKDYIDFLNVEKFVGSQVGPMNLEHPEHWQGPYVQKNMTASGKDYQIVRTRKGYYIIPGDGVKLANGKTIGKDITIIYDTDIEALMRDKKALLGATGKPLAVRIETIQDRIASQDNSLLELPDVNS